MRRLQFVIIATLLANAALAVESGSGNDTRNAFGKIRPQSSFDGNFSWSVANGQAVMKADTVTNTGAAPAQFRFALWMTTAAYPGGSGMATAFYSLGTIGAGQTIAGNPSGTAVPWTNPGTGCYFVTLVLEHLNGSSYVVDDTAGFSLRFDLGGCITSFAANPPSIITGGTSTLSWTTLTGTPSIDNGVGAVASNGSASVHPASTTTYTLSLSNLANTFPPTRTATVTVTAPTPAPTATFTATPSSIIAGQSSVLAWTTTDATSVSISNGIGPVSASGSFSVFPTTSTTYTLTATGAGGTITKTAFVNVTAACSSPVINNVTFTPNPVVAGEPLTMGVNATGSNLTYEWFRGTSGDPASVSLGSGQVLTTSQFEAGSYWVRVRTSCGAAPSSSPTYGVALNTGSCTNASELCINGNRYKVTLSAKDTNGTNAEGKALYQTSSFGFFSLPSLTGDPNNPEVFVKIVGPVNGVPWIFYSGLTNLDYTLKIVDTTTGQSMKSYHVTPPASLSLTSKGDFDVNGATSSHCDAVSVTTRQDASGGTCTPDASSLCLLSKRFRVTLAARDDPARTGRTDTGLSVSRSDAFGFFSFPGLTGDPKNLEVFIKMVDATRIGSGYWVFLGGLTDLEYTATITDVVTGKTRVYKKPLGSTCGWNDTSAF